MTFRFLDDGPIDFSTAAHKAQRITSHTADDLDTIQSKSKRQDQALLSDISARLVGAGGEGRRGGRGRAGAGGIGDTELKQSLMGANKETIKSNYIRTFEKRCDTQIKNVLI